MESYAVTPNQPSSENSQFTVEDIERFYKKISKASYHDQVLSGLLNMFMKIYIEFQNSVLMSKATLSEDKLKNKKLILLNQLKVLRQKKFFEEKGISNELVNFVEQDIQQDGKLLKALLAGKEGNFINQLISLSTKYQPDYNASFNLLTRSGLSSYEKDSIQYASLADQHRNFQNGLVRMGLANLRIGDWKNAKLAFDQALSVPDMHKDDRENCLRCLASALGEEAHSFYFDARKYSNHGEFDKAYENDKAAIKSISEAISKMNEITIKLRDDEKDIASLQRHLSYTLCALGETYALNNDFDNAILAYKQAIDTMDKMNPSFKIEEQDDPYLRLYQINLADIYFKKIDDYPAGDRAAVNYIMQAIDTLENCIIKMDHDLAKLCLYRQELAYQYTSRGDTKKAMDIYHYLISKLHAINDRSLAENYYLANCHLNMANCLDKDMRTEKKLNEAFTIIDKRDNHFKLAIDAYNEVINAETSNAENDQDLPLVEDCRNKLERCYRGSAFVSGDRALLYFDEAKKSDVSRESNLMKSIVDFSKATLFFKKFITNLTSDDKEELNFYQNGLITAYQSYANYLYEQQKYTSAITMYKKAMAIFNESPDLVTEKDAKVSLQRDFAFVLNHYAATLSQNNRILASDYLRQAINLIEEIPSKTPSDYNQLSNYKNHLNKLTSLNFNTKNRMTSNFLTFPSQKNNFTLDKPDALPAPNYPHKGISRI